MRTVEKVSYLGKGYVKTISLWSRIIQLQKTLSFCHINNERNCTEIFQATIRKRDFL